MKKTSLLSISAVLLMVVAALAAEKNLGSATLIIPGGSKTDVILPHHLHQNELGDCNLCHGLFPRSAGSIAELKESGELKKMQVMRQCMDCHKERARAGQKTGPLKCVECHPEK